MTGNEKRGRERDDVAQAKGNREMTRTSKFNFTIRVSLIWEIMKAADESREE